MELRTGAARRARLRFVEKVAKAIYKAEGWTHWPMDSTDPDRDADEVCDKYLKMARAAITACKREMSNV